MKPLKLYVLAQCLLLAALGLSVAHAADVVPNEIMMPGTQPGEVGNFESPDKCDNCHSGYNAVDPGAEPATGWRGAAMGNAGRDPVFWATLAVAEQDFDGAGDLCIRCHSAGGWYGGRSTPTDGSGLAASDDDGIDCDTCHASTDTDNSEYLGEMNFPFVANDCKTEDPVLCAEFPQLCCTDPNNIEGYYGSGMLSLWPQVNEKLGPYGDADARHQWQQSAWHRDPDFCGTCHDVSNSAVGDLAGNHGAQPGAPVPASSHDFPCDGPDAVLLPNGGCLSGEIEDKAAFNNPPYAFGIVERTFSEYKSSALWETLVSDFNNPGVLPDDLKVAGGSLEVTYQAALLAGTGGNYWDGTPRYFTCQSCHMRPTIGPGCNKRNVKIRQDLPRHDHTGGNYWFASMAQYQDGAGTLRLGDGLSGVQLAAMDLGQERAVKHLTEAAALSVTGNTVTITNLTGHKLITGYPEGRRMWLNIKWYDDQGNLVGEDGEYGSLTVDLDGDGLVDDTVETILDLDGTNTEIYEAHYAITKEWAGIVQALHGPNFALSYDRVSGLPDCTVSQFLADASPDCSGPYHNTFHFALNNYVSSDNRIPPYNMSYAEAKRRNALPVPETRYSRAGDTYEYADDVLLSPPGGAVYATIDLLYQGTSWEYVLFLQRANNEQNVFLAQEGNNMMDAWLNADVVKSTGDPITGVQMVNGDYKMVPPVVMATVEWGQPPVCTPTEDPEVSCQDGVDNDCDGFIDNADPDCDGCTPTGPDTNCNGVDEDCDGVPDDDYVPTDTTCGIGECGSTGQLVCVDGATVDSCTPGTPDTEGPFGDPTCSDGLDNDCDGETDTNGTPPDADCQEQVNCSVYGNKTDCNNDPSCKWQGSPTKGSCVNR
ncbi:MAG: hypothetical protein PVF51_02350 [Nitrospirota bacterium]|jgi:hypothetical protein